MFEQISQIIKSQHLCFFSGRTLKLEISQVDFSEIRTENHIA